MVTRGPGDDPGPVDVVEGGDKSGLGAGLPRWVPRAAAGLAAVVAVLAVTRGGLLSSDGAPPAPSASTMTARAASSTATALGRGSVSVARAQCSRARQSASSA